MKKAHIMEKIDIRKFIIVFYFLTFFLISIPFLISCKQEASCDCFLDSIKIARIFNPDGAIGKDAIIESIIPDNNLGNESLFGTFSWTNSGLFNHSRGLIVFDLSSIPESTIIKKAFLNLYWIQSGNLTEHTGENIFSIFRITEYWDEQSVTWNNQPGVSSDNPVVVAKSTNMNQNYTIDVTLFVQYMINHPTENYGFLIKLNEEIPYKSVVVASSDYAESDKHPKLVVYY